MRSCTCWCFHVLQWTRHLGNLLYDWLRANAHHCPCCDDDTHTESFYLDDEQQLKSRRVAATYRARKVALESLKDKVKEELLEKFGEYDSTAELIDKAVKVLSARMDVLIQKRSSQDRTALQQQLFSMHSSGGRSDLFDRTSA